MRRARTPRAARYTKHAFACRLRACTGRLLLCLPVVADSGDVAESHSQYKKPSGLLSPNFFRIFAFKFSRLIFAPPAPINLPNGAFGERVVNRAKRVIPSQRNQGKHRAPRATWLSLWPATSPVACPDHPPQTPRRARRPPRLAPTAARAFRPSLSTGSPGFPRDRFV